MRWQRNAQGKTLDPRRRRRVRQWLAEGYKNPESRLFSNPTEYQKDMELVMRVLRKKGYHIPQRMYDAIIGVPLDIAEDKLKNNEGEHVPAEVQHRLRASNLLRMVVKDAKEIELIDAELELLRKESKPEVFIREDEEFFGNEAHEKAKRESQGSDQGKEPPAGDCPAKSPTAPTGDSSGSASP